MVDRDCIDSIKRDRGRLVAALTDAGATIDGDRVRCPFHQDEHPSGGVHEHDGRWLYTCQGCAWHGERRTGDVFAVVQRARGVSFGEACRILQVGGNGSATADAKPKPVATPKASPADLEREADEANRRLVSDGGALEHLFNTRGIDADTARRFGIGITGKAGARFWTFPIKHGGRTVSIKAHRADGQNAKSWWQPKGADSRRLWPVALESDGPVWLCPGELKALAVVGVGRAAVAITSGEGSEKRPASLPAEVFELLRGRSVAVVGDDDATGAAWARHVVRQLADAGIAARAVDVGLDKSAGLKDIGDWVVRRLVEDGKDANAVAATLDEHWRRADPWFGTTIADLWTSPATWRAVQRITTGLADLDHALGGGFRTRGVHMLVGKPNKGKSQLAVCVATNAARKRVPAAIFSLEMTAEEVSQLVAAQLGGIPRRSLEYGRPTGEYGRALDAVTRAHANTPLFVLDAGRWRHGLTRESFEDLVGQGVQRFGWRLIVLDYLALLASLETDKSEYTSDLLNSAALRRMSQEFDIALVVVAALRKSANYKSVQKAETVVTLDDVSGAGRLTYDAQTVMFVAAERGDRDCGIMRVRPLKMRFSPLIDGQDIQLRWWPTTGAIEDLK